MKRIICGFFVLGLLFCACGSKQSEYFMEAVEDDAEDIQYQYAAEDIQYDLDEDLVKGDKSHTFRWSSESDVVAANTNKLGLTANEVQSPKKDNKNADLSKTADVSMLMKKKIIKDGDMTVQTNDIAVSKKGIDNLVRSLNGYYQREDLNNGTYRISYDLIIRVPAENFDKLVSSVEQGKDEIMDKSIRARDVTEEYVDINIRLSSKKEYLKQYSVLLSKATTIKDIVEIKEIIRSLHEEIERAEGRLRYLNDQVAFSTLKVNLFKDIEYVYKPQPQDSFIERAKSGLSTGWKIVKETALFLTNIWSVLLVLGLVSFLVWKKMQRKKTKG